MSDECNKCDSILKENTLDPYSPEFESYFRKWTRQNHPDKVKDDVEKKKTKRFAWNCK